MTEQQGIWPGVSVEEPLRGAARDVARRRAQRAEERDVVIPAIANPDRRARCRLSLLRFLTTYFAALFPLRFSWDHLHMIHSLQRCILRGQCYVIAAPRGSGKSTIVIGACVWALLYGHRHFLVILCGNHTNSRARLDAIRMAMETNDLLAADFPGPCACVRSLQGAWNRANAQTVRGERTYINWGGTEMLTFPTLAGDPSSAACIATRSMKTAIRGINYYAPDGTMRRPDMVLFDDPIEKDQAHSPTIVENREDKIDSDALQLGGPGVALAAVMLITVIEDEDLATHYLDKIRHPAWHRAKFKLMYALPQNTELWEQYQDLRIKSFETHRDSRLCDAFYAAHRAEMDAGARPAWRERFSVDKGEVSATQHAMNIIYDDGEDVFLAEYQNEPRPAEDAVALVLTSYRVERAHSGLPRGEVPNNALALVCGADVNKFGIHWAVIGAAAGRLVSVVDYGVQDTEAPVGRIEEGDHQKRMALTLTILDGLRRLRDKLEDPDNPFLRSDGTAAALTLGLVDSRWMTPVVDAFCRESGRWFPAMGCGTRKHTPKFRPPKGAQLSLDGNVYVKIEEVLDASGRATGERQRRFFAHADAYKQALHAGFFLDAADPGAVRVFDPTHRKDHHSYARHLTAELQIEKSPGHYVWDTVRGRADNHYLDATYLALCGLSVLAQRIPALAITGVADAEPDPDGKPQADRRTPRRRQPVQVTTVEI